MKITTVILLIILGVGLIKISNIACNPKGSLAAKINWAGNRVCK